MKDPAVEIPLADLCAGLLKELETEPRMRLVAESAQALVPGSAVLVFVVATDTEPVWLLKAIAGDIAVNERIIPYEAGTLGAVARGRETIQFTSEELNREEFAHLNLRQNFTALTYRPITRSGNLLGCIEIVSFSDPPSSHTLTSLSEIATYAASALTSSAVYESERNASLSSVMRLTQLYDIEKVFNATLEMQPLFEVICSKVQDLTKAAAVNLWMVEQEDLSLMHQVGEDPAATLGDRQSEREGIIATVGETGEDLLVQADEELLVSRNLASPDREAVSLMAAALINEEALVGVLEVVSTDPARIFSEDDLFMLNQVAASAAQALHNSSLLQAERKIQVLQTLVSVAQEISSTLNLQRVLETIVSQPQLVIPYERAAIALERRNRTTVAAISGVLKLDSSSPDVKLLNDILSWVSGLGSEIHVSQHGDEISDERPETREKFLRYFEATGSRSFYAVPLNDDEGTLGILSLESPDPDFLTELHFEIIKVLTSQATLALRNASLYKEVPFIGILEPLIEKKRRFMAIEKRRRTLILLSIVATLFALVVIPVPMRVTGHAQVAPSQVQDVRAEEDGVIQQVLIHEGEKVLPGTPLLKMTDWQQRAALAGVEAKYNTSMTQFSRALVNNDTTAAGQRQLEANYLRQEMIRSTEELARMTIRAEIPATVVTPHAENLVGRKVSVGDPLLQLARTESVIVDVAIPERDVALLKVGQSATIKLDSFPQFTFRGPVQIVSASSDSMEDTRVFYARIALTNTTGVLKPGMSGLSKVNIGSHPLGYVLFRDIALWGWAKLWSWFSW